MEILHSQSYHLQLQKSISVFQRGFCIQKIYSKVEVLKLFKISSNFHKSIPISQMEDYFENP